MRAPATARRVLRVRLRGSSSAWRTVQKTGGAPRVLAFAHCFAGRTTTASEVAHGKPAPDLFLLAAEKHGVAPERCLVIEDSAAGIAAAKAAGVAALEMAPTQDSSPNVTVLTTF